MHEILRHLPESACVLDVGCRAGSFDASLYPVRTIRLDRDAPPGSPLSDFVQGDVADLPFRSGAFAAVISNHSLEHFEKLHDALREIARVVKADGSIYIAVPDAGTVCDRVYRWLGKGGGHVNAFRSREEVIALIEQYTGLRIAASRSLMASFSFLNRKNWATWAPRRLLLVGGGMEGTLVGFNGVARLLDRWFHTRIGLYGWAFYFGSLEEEIDSRPWSNVCVRCGSGYASAWLQAAGLVHRSWGFFHGFRCPACNAWNLFTDDAAYLHLE